MTLSIALLYMLVNTTISPQTITHCRGVDGSIAFTDRSCPEGSVPIDRGAQTLNILTFEQAVHVPSRVSAKKGKRKPRIDRKQACEQARVELKALRAERRRGYRLSDAAKLDARLDQLKADKRALC